MLIKHWVCDVEGSKSKVTRAFDDGVVCYVEEDGATKHKRVKFTLLGLYIGTADRPRGSCSQCSP